MLDLLRPVHRTLTGETTYELTFEGRCLAGDTSFTMNRGMQPYTPHRKRRGLFFLVLRDLDSNQGPPGYEPDELPDCSITPG